MLRSLEYIAETPNDALTSFLETLRARSVFYGRWETNGSWGIDYEPRENVAFHYQVTGESWIYLPGAEPIRMREGDLVVLPHAGRHEMRTGSEVQSESLSRMVAKYGVRPGLIRCGQEPFGSVVICGGYMLDREDHRFLLRATPKVIAIPAADREKEPWVEATLKFIACESQSARPGASAVIRRMSDVLLIQVLRHWSRQAGGEAQSWLRGLADPSIRQALSLMHSSPERDWTVPELAKAAGLSRSVFAERFQEVTGASPAQYLTVWRLHIAARLLEQTKLGLLEVAERVGYQSEAAFSRVFRRHRGVAPGQWRAGRRRSTPSSFADSGMA